MRFIIGLDDAGQLPVDVEDVVGLAVAACQGNSLTATPS
jgi:hypothetical protein